MHTEDALHLVQMLPDTAQVQVSVHALQVRFAILQRMINKDCNSPVSS